MEMETAILRADESDQIYELGSHQCFGCNNTIDDQFLSKVLDEVWHDDCIRCCTCRKLLRDKCFSRDFKLYCKDDFYRTFGVKCSGCDHSIYPSDLVRRISQKIFHLSCLRCVRCKHEVATGDQLYVMEDGSYFCKTDYEQFASSMEDGVKLEDASRHEYESSYQAPTPPHNLNNNINNNINNIMNSISNNDGSQGSDDDDDANRRRGPRTTIKAKQLELLKQAFVATPKPSRHVREKLAQDTGLTMRVIQVWFQNRRSKERRVKQLSIHDPSRKFRPDGLEKDRTPLDMNYQFFQSPTGPQEFQQRIFNFEQFPNAGNAIPFPLSNDNQMLHQQQQHLQQQQQQQQQQQTNQENHDNIMENVKYNGDNRAKSNNLLETFNPQVPVTSGFNGFPSTFPGQPLMSTYEQL